MNSACYTAIITPFSGDVVDKEGLARLVAFQTENGVNGILAVGTTGESPTLAWDEHHYVVKSVAQQTKGKSICIAGAGSNNTKEALSATEHAVAAGADSVLLVDPYYNGPSSLEIRKEYVAPVAKAFPGIGVIPYVIPGRTGAQLFPEDLALLYKDYENVNTVKEATGNLDNMKRTRECCGPDFTIMSGDDGMTYKMMTDPAIQAAGVISVMTNIAPKAVSDMVKLLADGQTQKAKSLDQALAPLFSLVTVTTTEKTPYGEVICRARNPLAVKTLMQVLGMPSGPCRQPLGKMSKAGLEIVLAAARSVQSSNPEIFQPLADFFNVDIEKQLSRSSIAESVCYPGY